MQYLYTYFLETYYRYLTLNVKGEKEIFNTIFETFNYEVKTCYYKL